MSFETITINYSVNYDIYATIMIMILQYAYAYSYNKSHTLHMGVPKGPIGFSSGFRINNALDVESVPTSEVVVPENILMSKLGATAGHIHITHGLLK